MSILANKHVVIAMIVAPILAIGSYFAVDSLLAEAPISAEPGGNYQLVEKPNCRYTSGQCDLKNGNFELSLRNIGKNDNELVLDLRSVHPLTGVKIAYGQKAENLRPNEMKNVDDTGLHWQLTIPTKSDEKNRLYVVAAANKALYFGDTSLVFVDYQTTFEKDFR